MAARELSDTRRAFAFERLFVDPAFARHHQIAVRDVRFDLQHLGYDIKSRANLCSAKTKQTKSETTGGAGSGDIAEVASEFLRNHVSEVFQAEFQSADRKGIRPFLGSKHLRGAAGAEQRVQHVGRGDDFGKR